MKKFNVDLPVLKCWACSCQKQPNHWCSKCQSTGKIFWADGAAFPYTPTGEKAALRRLEKVQQ